MRFMYRARMLGVSRVRQMAIGDRRAYVMSCAQCWSRVLTRWMVVSGLVVHV